ncbi:MAG: tetratricopeptide repeat protein, partial [Phycisphaerae bacterium]
WVLINGGNPREIGAAIKLLQEALAIAPKHLQARELLGAILKTEAGILRDMAKRDPARADQAQAKLAEARTLLETLVKDDPKRPVAWRTLGLMAMQDRRFDDAQKAFQELQLLRPLEDTSYQNLAGIYLIRKDIPAAISQLMELQQHEQHDERIPRKLAELLRQQATGKGEAGDWREAESMAYKAVRINPYNAINHDLLAAILLAEKQPARAVEYYRHATELQPKIAQYWEGLAEALGQSGDAAGAAEAAKKAVELSPGSAATKWLKP